MNEEKIIELKALKKEAIYLRENKSINPDYKIARLFNMIEEIFNIIIEKK